MSTMIQIRNVPDVLHRRLKSRASLEGLSLSGYLLREIGQVASRPTLQELAERLAQRTPVKYKVSPAEILREERGRR
jgi:plasmid stability protein